MNDLTAIDVTITGATNPTPAHTIWTTSVPGVIVKRTVFDAVSQMREILVVNDDSQIIERGPTVHQDKVFGGAVRIYTSWSSGKASSVEEMDKQILLMRVAAWMQMEMEMGIN